MTLEPLALWCALIAYVAAGSLAIIAQVWKRKPERWILGLMGLGLSLHTLFISLRWIRIEHLPVGSTFEAVQANIWGLMIAVVLVYWRIPKIRPVAVVMMPIVFLLMGWMLLIPNTDSKFPPFYDTIWLFIHVGLIKVFLGAALAAVGLGGIILLRRRSFGQRHFARMPGNISLDNLAYRFLAVAFIFDSLGVIAGAIWAMDAWGRYWNWDPLEIWSFLTWLTLAFALHLRITRNNPPETNSIISLMVFVIAFFTFFGIPFVSVAMHQGAV